MIKLYAKPGPQKPVYRQSKARPGPALFLLAEAREQHGTDNIKPVRETAKKACGKRLCGAYAGFEREKLS